MRKIFVIISLLFSFIIIVISCSTKEVIQGDAYPAITAAFGDNIDPDDLANYANQQVPAYIQKDNTNGNTITDIKATLGRVLFYDKNLSVNKSISCGSCHKQQFAFGDTALQSSGVLGGLTGRHSMRLVNARFATESKFFWNERSPSLEHQTTQPVQDHAEMGFSGQPGRENINDLLNRLKEIDYYKELFTIVYGDVNITEARMQECLAQFIRSIQSFDSKYDIGRAQVNADNQPFPNFTQQENAGKNLFLAPPVFNATGIRINGGAGCQGCHRAPEFDINPNSRNNGIVAIINAPGIDLFNTRAPSLRDIVNRNGQLNTSLMHNGIARSLETVVGHYDSILVTPGNTNLDPRLTPGGMPQRLRLTTQQINNISAFLRTLTGNDMYVNSKWSDPFL